MQRWAKRYNVDFARNPYSKLFDFSELDRGALVAIEDGRGDEYVTTIFAAIWARPPDLSQRSVLIDIMQGAGFDAPRLMERANAQDVIARFEAETGGRARGVRCTNHVRWQSNVFRQRPS